MDEEDDFHPKSPDDLAKSSQNSSNKQRKVRGVAVLERISKRSSRDRILVTYNRKGQPNGKTRKDFASYRGLLAKAMVPISYPSWPKVPKSLKENLWIAMEAKFNMDPKSKKRVISAMGCSWKNFKGELTKSYVKPFKDDPGNLWNRPEKFKKFIDQEDWDAFVRGRLSQKFEKLSDVQRERRAKNKFNHKLSKLGYAGLEEIMKERHGDAFDEDDRSLMWITARQSRNREYQDDATKEVGEKIDALKKQVHDGSLVTQGTSDVLTLALGTPEYSGRVRGMGKGVTPTTYFHIPRRGSKQHVEELEYRLHQEEEKAKEKDRLLQEAMEELRKYQSRSLAPSLVEKISSNSQKSDNKKYEKYSNYVSESCDSPSKRKKEKAQSNVNRQCIISPPDPKSNIGKGKRCRLELNSHANVVASGVFF